MTPRPRLAPKSRPLSAIYIGSGSTPTSSPPAIPDLPEPPSPSSSNASGLPSPPATNSTGSGSVDDDSTNSGSLRRRTSSRSDSFPEMSNGEHYKSHNGSRSRQNSADEEEDPWENENEEHTARLIAEGRRAVKALPDDNMSALQRVKNLTQRNRMVLDKLSSISRLSSPAPSNHPRSPMSPPSAGSSSSSSRLSSAHSRPQSASNPLPSPHSLEPSHSGSETERESQRFSNHSYSSSDDLSATPPSHSGKYTAPPIRERRISEPASPARPNRTQRDRDRGPSPGPSRSPRKGMSAHNAIYDDEDRDDVTAAALAAVASSRRSPTGRRNRQPLPREFKERDRRSLDGKGNSGEPATPHRRSERNNAGRASPTSPRGPRSNAQSSLQMSPHRAGQARFSTVRELARKHQTRWMSEDLSAAADGEEDPAYNATGSGPGRRQGHRGGSSDGYLISNGGRLVGEGLRAAGLTKRRDVGEDPFVGGSVGAEMSPRRTKSTGNSSVAQADWEPSPASGSRARMSEGVGPPGGQFYDPKTPLLASQRIGERSSRAAMLLTRPGTSMAALHHDNHDNPPPKTAPPGLRQYKSNYQLVNRDRIPSPQFQQESSQPTTDRAYSSPYTALRAVSAAALPSSNSPALTGISRDMNAEHRRLMMEALGMFESQLSRLPPMGQVTTNTIPELFQNAQQLVHMLDKVNVMLKSSTNRAMEAQIDAEVADNIEGIDLVNLWRTVGGDFRESARVSDEVVRNMTGFLLGVGKILRESTSHSGQQHLRTMSLDEDVARRLTPEVALTATGRSSDGQKSRETRRSWDPREAANRDVRLPSRENSLVRPGSSLNMLRGSATSSSEGRSVAEAVGEQTPQTVRNVSGLAPSSSIRRLYLTRDQRATPDSLAPIRTSFEVADSPQSHEPSPTPTSRTSHSALSERPRAFPPLAVAPTLSTLPSESLLNRSEDSENRRKVSNNSNITVRADGPAGLKSVIKPANPTTALTPHTVSMLNSPAEAPSPKLYPLNRSESSGSSRTNGVAFSHPSSISANTLSGLQERDGRMRTGSSASFANDEDDGVPRSMVRLAPAALISPMSGSETERPESWRRTIGARPRASLDGVVQEDDSERRSTLRNATISAARKERRRTITEIFQGR